MDRDDGRASPVPVLRPWDLRTAAVLGALTPVAWLIPPSRWPAAARFVMRAVSLTTPQYRAHRRASFPEAHLRRLGMSPDEAFLHYETLAALEIVRALRAHAPMGWRPPLRLRGAEHLDAALERGHGAVLWLAGISQPSLRTMMALARAGYAVHHLSRPAHGYSTSLLGRRWLNPIRTRAEERHLAARIIISETEPTASLRRLREELRDGGIVSITAIISPSASSASQVTSAELLGHPVAIPTGPITLARNSGAALLMVTGATKKDGTFEVTIWPALPTDRAGRQKALRASTDQFVEQLGRAVEQHWEQWTDWRALHRDRARG